MENIQIIKQLGKGSMGEVVLVKMKDHYYAIKKIPKTLTKREQLKESFDKEVMMLNQLKNNYIITLLKVYEDANFHYLTL